MFDKCSLKRKAKSVFEIYNENSSYCFLVQNQIFVISAVNLAIGAKVSNGTNHHPEEKSLDNNFSLESFPKFVCWVALK